jgi:hypothetical protein
MVKCEKGENAKRRTVNAKCENSQTAKKMKTVKTQKCENSQNAKM